MMSDASNTGDRPTGPGDGETPNFIERSLADRVTDTRGSSEHVSTVPEKLKPVLEGGEPVRLAEIAALQGGPRRPWGESFGLRDGYMPIVTLGPDTEVRTVFDPHLVRELPPGLQEKIDEKARTALHNERRYFLDSIAVLPAVGKHPAVVVKYYGPSTWARDSTLVADYYGGGGARTPEESALRFPGQTGANVLVVTKNGEYVISDSAPKPYLPPRSVGVVSETLSRSEDSRPEDGAPDLLHCALRAVSTEFGILEDNVKLEHIGMGTTRAGICDDLWIAQTDLTIDQIRALHQDPKKAPEGWEHVALHAVPSDPASLMNFFVTPNADGKFPILTSPAQAVLYAAVRRSEHGEEGIRRIESMITDAYRQDLEAQLRETGHW